MSAGDKDHNDTCRDYESGCRWLHEFGSAERDINIERMPDTAAGYMNVDLKGVI